MKRPILSIALCLMTCLACANVNDASAMSNSPSQQASSVSTRDVTLIQGPEPLRYFVKIYQAKDVGPAKRVAGKWETYTGYKTSVVQDNDSYRWWWVIIYSSDNLSDVRSFVNNFKSVRDKYPDQSAFIPYIYENKNYIAKSPAPSERPVTSTEYASSEVITRSEFVDHVSGPSLNRYAVVVGSLSLINNANGLAAILSNKGFTPTIAKNKNRLFRVTVGTSNDLSQVAELKNSLRSSYPDAWILENANKSGGSNSERTSSAVSQTIPKTTQPPILDIVSNSMTFTDKSGANAIGANGSYAISFKLHNSGKGSGTGCKVKVQAKGSTQGIQFSDITLPRIEQGSTVQVDVPVRSNRNTANGQVEFSIQIDEPNGFGTDPHYISVNTRAFVAPHIKVADYSVTSESGTQLRKKLPFDLQLLLQNVQTGMAENVSVDLETPNNVLVIEGQKQQSLGVLNGGETKSLVYSLIVNNNYTNSVIPIKVHLKEKYGQYAEDRTINLTLDQAMASTKIAVEARQEQPKGEVTIARLGSDVDKDLPQTSAQQQKTFVVIIANEHYKTVEGVPFANSDGRMFEAYCQQTLGIPGQNIRTVTDATLNDMKFQIDWLRQVMQTFNGEARAIVYYAGHGVPDEQSHNAFLLPIDGYVGNTSSAYSLEEFYKTLSSLPARSVTVFLDACFSGTRRDGKMLASARGVAIKAKTSTPQGSMVVFSAAQGDETAYPYQDQQHGMFTYYLLKKLKESKGEATLGDLSSYVTQEVKRQSIIQNSKMQTPTVTVSPSVGQSWYSMKLK